MVGVALTWWEGLLYAASGESRVAGPRGGKGKGQ